MPWSHQANLDMQEIKRLTDADDSEMEQLMASMGQWARANLNGRHFIPFGRFRDHGVSFVVENGEIMGAQYGDTL